MNEKNKIKALIEAVRGLQEEGYRLIYKDNFIETTGISESGKQYKTRQLKFYLSKHLPQDRDEEEISHLIQSLNHTS